MEIGRRETMATLRTLPFQTIGLPVIRTEYVYHKETLNALSAEHMSTDR